mmetsp:Transcript_29256/g.84757  ORF Transcript_29256/g.84757 Transcript_29256/m.84757 type:complete len:514 (-) Transcript_29256:281-1822(-)
MGNHCGAAVAFGEEQMISAGDRVFQRIERIVRRPKEERCERSAAASRVEPRKVDFSMADIRKWTLDEYTYGGKATFNVGIKLVKERIDRPIEEGLAMLKESPADSEGMYFQASVQTKCDDEQWYTVIKRTGAHYMPKAGGEGFIYKRLKYQALPPLEGFACDEHTETILRNFAGKPLGKPLCPGRGHGIADVPGLRMIVQADPCDVSQGMVGDCWLLSAISALAEYKGAIAWLFRKTPGFQRMPSDGPNKYIVTLKDVQRWEDVDIEIDERLCTRAEGTALFGCAPSVDGELWACYLEKAVAVHCGGWDKIDGGKCIAAWRLLVGCRNQYIFEQDAQGMWHAIRDFDPDTQRWADFSNDGHINQVWSSDWPEVGGRGELGQKIAPDDMFRRMLLWEDHDYLMGCATAPGSDKTSVDGMVQGHAYAILQCEQDVAGKGINMIKVRNPWGTGEFQSGIWDDDGPGWAQHPEVKAALKPAKADDGVFWMQQEEFFKYFRKVYLSAESMENILKNFA